MKANEIKVGGIYVAKVSGKLTEVRVDEIRERPGFRSGGKKIRQDRTVYGVTNLKTGRTTTFESAMKFRGVVDPNQSARRLTKVKTPLIPELEATGIACEKPFGENVTLGFEHGHPRADDGRSGDDLEGENCSDPTLAVALTDRATTERPVFVSDVSRTEKNSVDQPNESGESGTPNTSDSTTLTPVGSSLASRLRSNVVRPISGGLTPTPEQEEILAAVQRDVPVVVVEAGAGTGKTSTLKMIGETLPGNGQYTAFNSSLVAESKTKFAGSTVTCNTTHSLAFRAEGVRFAHRLGGGRVRGDQLAEMLGISALTVPFGSTEKRLSPGYLASQVMGAVKRFCQSADPEIDVSHFRYVDGIDMPTDDGQRGYSSNGMVRDYLLPFARKAWKDLSSPEGTLPFSHDHYVKVWQLGNPVIAADYILVDESQDSAPVFLDILKQQTCKIIFVGDSAQQIYEWRGAVNAMADFPDAPRCLLSQSFRFGQAIAEVANAVLATLEEPTKLRLKGFDKIESRVEKTEQPTAILTRTNAVAVASLLSAIAEGKTPFLVGGGSDTIAFVEAAQKLQNGESTSHPDLACFSSWGEVQEYVKQDEGDDLKLMVKIIDEFKPATLLNALRSMPATEDLADIVICTAHKSKGREWDRVKLAADFPTKSKCCDSDRKLLYVAVTRAKLVLDVTSCPFFIGQDSLDIRSIRDRYHSSATVQSNGGVIPEAPSTPPVPTQFTWANKDGKWCVRGPNGKLGETVDVVRKDGSKQKKKLLLVVQEFESATLYKV